MEHPGVDLQNKISALGMTRKELAVRTGVSEKHICTVLNGSRDISATFARKLGYVFEDSRYWLGLQSAYDDEQSKIKEQNGITVDEINLLKPLHEIIAYFLEKGYMHNDCGEASKVLQLRKLLNISNLTAIPQITYNAAYRAQLTSNIKVDPYVLFAWQRMCEIETDTIEVNGPLNNVFLYANIDLIKSLMHEDINSGVKKLRKILADCGIAFEVVRHFRGAPVQGFIKETPEKRLILCLTIRRQRADVFWFSLFHEIGHIINGDYTSRFVDFDTANNEAEAAANVFARDALINPAIYRRFVFSSNPITWQGIEALAKEAGVEPFIVLGRLQNDGYLDWTDYPEKVRNYKWV